MTARRPRVRPDAAVPEMISPSTSQPTPARGRQR